MGEIIFDNQGTRGTVRFFPLGTSYRPLMSLFTLIPLTGFAIMLAANIFMITGPEAFSVQPKSKRDWPFNAEIAAEISQEVQYEVTEKEWGFINEQRDKNSLHCFVMFLASSVCCFTLLLSASIDVGKHALYLVQNKGSFEYQYGPHDCWEQRQMVMKDFEMNELPLHSTLRNDNERRFRLRTRDRMRCVLIYIALGLGELALFVPITLFEVKHGVPDRVRESLLDVIPRGTYSWVPMYVCNAIFWIGSLLIGWPVSMYCINHRWKSHGIVFSTSDENRRSRREDQRHTV